MPSAKKKVAKAPRGAKHSKVDKEQDQARRMADALEKAQRIPIKPLREEEGGNLLAAAQREVPVAEWLIVPFPSPDQCVKWAEETFGVALPQLDDVALFAYKGGVFPLGLEELAQQVPEAERGMPNRGVAPDEAQRAVARAYHTEAQSLRVVSRADWEIGDPDVLIVVRKPSVDQQIAWITEQNYEQWPEPGTAKLIPHEGGLYPFFAREFLDHAVANWDA